MSVDTVDSAGDTQAGSWYQATWWVMDFRVWASLSSDWICSTWTATASTILKYPEVLSQHYVARWMPMAAYRSKTWIPTEELLMVIFSTTVSCSRFFRNQQETLHFSCIAVDVSQVTLWLVPQIVGLVWRLMMTSTSDSVQLSRCCSWTTLSIMIHDCVVVSLRTIPIGSTVSIVCDCRLWRRN